MPRFILWRELPRPTLTAMQIILFLKIYRVQLPGVDGDADTMIDLQKLNPVKGSRKQRDESY